jgi:hypothetical protein
MGRHYQREARTYESSLHEGDEPEYQPLVFVEEGKYEVTPLRSFQFWYMRKRCDLRIEFALVSGDHKGELITGYWQVKKWLNDRRFSVGPKSNFFRMFQDCFGSQDTNEFDLECLHGRTYLADITNVAHDPNGHNLKKVNQYSRVARLLEVVEETGDDIPF